MSKVFTRTLLLSCHSFRLLRVETAKALIVKSLCYEGYGTFCNNNDTSEETLMSGNKKQFPKDAADKLNKDSGKDLNRREWGRALEEMKKENGLRGDDHGKLLRNGDFYDTRGTFRGNIHDYIP